MLIKSLNNYLLDSKEIDETELWHSFKEGNEQSLSKIFLTYFDDLANYGFKLVKEEDLVKDCIQELFLKLWKNRNNLRDIKFIKPYLFKSLRRQIFDRLSALNKKKYIDRFYNEGFDIEFSHEDFLITRQLSKEVSHRLIACLNKLTKRQKEAVYLKFYEGLSYEKISEIMSLNAQSIRNLICQGIKTLKENISVIQYFLLLFIASEG